MQLSINSDLLLKAIKLIFKTVNKRHNIVILTNIKLEVTQQLLILTASDLEVELSAQVKLSKDTTGSLGSTTLPADKLFDICKQLPENTVVNFNAEANKRCVITSGMSRFVLGTLPAEDFPTLGTPSNIKELTLSRNAFMDLITKTQFAMAIQDVRYYLTGMLFEVNQNQLTTVATDGHRLALASSIIEKAESLEMQAILPRKAVMELERLGKDLEKMLERLTKKFERVVDANKGKLTLSFGREFLQVSLPFGNAKEDVFQINEAGQLDDTVMITLTARLIDGKYPDYRRVIPHNTNKVALVDKDQINDALLRVSILSNEKSGGVVFTFLQDGNVKIRANNAEQDEAVESLKVQYQGEPIELSFNAAYLRDTLQVLNGNVLIHMSQANSSVLVTQQHDNQHQYVIMPMRI